MLKAEEALVISKNFTKETADEFGAVKGAACQIQSIEKSGDVNIVIFLWRNSRDEERTSQMLVQDGISITNAVVVTEGEKKGHLIVTLSNNSTIDAGSIEGPKGDTGDSGFSPIITVKTNTPGTYILTITTAEGSFDTPNLKGGGGGGSSELSSDLEVSVSVGGVNAGTEYEAGTPLETVIRNVLSPTLYPSFTAPSASLTATGAKLLESGASLDVTFTITFNRGAITPAYGTSGYRSGVASRYSLEGITQSGNTFSETITSEKTSYQGSVSYEAGEQPKDSDGGDYDSPLPAGSVNTNTVNYEFVDALWANTSSIGTIAKLALVSKTAKVKAFSFPASTVADPEVFDVPASWTVTGVEVLNTLSNQWESATGQFNVSNVSHYDAAGGSVAYKRYTCNLGMALGARQVRVKWS